MENTNQSVEKSSNFNFKEAKYATGRRKTSIAKVWLAKGSGKILINGKDYKKYFSRANHIMQLLRPFEIINQSSDYDVKCNVTGGGLTGQVGALVHGISKALLLFDLNLKPVLKKRSLPLEILDLLKEKNMVTEKLEEVFNFLKDKINFLNYYAQDKCINCWINWLHRYSIDKNTCETQIC